MMLGRCGLVMISELVNFRMTIGIDLIGSGMMIEIDETGIDVCCNPALQSLSSHDPYNADQSALESGWLLFGMIALKKSFSFSSGVAEMDIKMDIGMDECLESTSTL